MSTENGKHIPTRAEFLEGELIRQVESKLDPDGTEWTLLLLDSGRQVLIREDCGWVMVDAEVH
jgi:hypothetical protein